MSISFDAYINSLSKEELESYALRSGTSSTYIWLHLKTRKKMPRKDLLLALANQSNGKFTPQDLLLWFYDLQAA